MFNVENNQEKNKKINIKKTFIIAIISIIVIITIVEFINLNNKSTYNNIKKDETKDLVYTIYKRSIDGSKTEVPKININSSDVDIINKEIIDNMNELLKEEYNVSNYEYSVNKNILSVVLIMINNNTEQTPIFNFKTYNINLNTLKRINNKEILNLYNTNELEVSKKIELQFKGYYNDEVKKGYIDKNECDYNCFKNWRNIEDYIEKVQYYIDDNKLYAYKEFNPYSIYEEEDYYNMDHFMFYIKD